MQINCKRLMAFGAAVLMLVFTGVAAASVVNGPEGHATPASRGFRLCPSRDRQSLASARTGADVKLVPAGAQQVLLCRYSGLGGFARPTGATSFRLIAHHLVTTHVIVASLASELNALMPATGARLCPSDTGTAIIARFRYGSDTNVDDPVTIALLGCSSVTNGHLQRTAGTVSGIKLVHQLTFLTPVASTSGTGILTGAIILAGGPALPRGEKRTPAAGLVRVFGAPGRLVARQHVRAGHLFRFRLAPGRYELPDPLPGVGIFSCPTAATVVTPGHTTHVDVHFGCGVP